MRAEKMMKMAKMNKSDQLFNLFFPQKAKKLNKLIDLNKKLSNQVRLKQAYIDKLTRELKRVKRC
jgi:hypothetical protein